MAGFLALNASFASSATVGISEEFASILFAITISLFEQPNETIWLWRRSGRSNGQSVHFGLHGWVRLFS